MSKSKKRNQKQKQQKKQLNKKHTFDPKQSIFVSARFRRFLGWVIDEIVKILVILGVAYLLQFLAGVWIAVTIIIIINLVYNGVSSLYNATPGFRLFSLVYLKYGSTKQVNKFWFIARTTTPIILAVCFSAFFDLLILYIVFLAFSLFSYVFTIFNKQARSAFDVVFKVILVNKKISSGIK